MILIVDFLKMFLLKIKINKNLFYELIIGLFIKKIFQNLSLNKN